MAPTRDSRSQSKGETHMPITSDLVRKVFKGLENGDGAALAVRFCWETSAGWDQSRSPAAQRTASASAIGRIAVEVTNTCRTISG